VGNRPTPEDRLFVTRWVHLFEEDTADGEVYAPEDGPIPLARRPRERLKLEADGSATLFMPGPDDRPAPRPARWSWEENGIVVRADGGGAALRVVQQSPTRLVIRRGAA
jgi:hypothetical protein